MQLEQGQPFQQPQGRLLGRVREFPPRGRRGQCRRRITQLEVGPRQPRPGLTPGSMSPVVSAMLTAWLEQRHRLACVARRQPGPAQVVKRDRLAVAVADVAGDGQRLGVQVDGLPVLAQAEAAVPQAAQRGCPRLWRSPMSRAMASAWV